MVHAANQVTVYSVYSAFSSAPRMNQSILVDRVDRQTRYSPSTVLRRSVKQSYSRISTYLIIEGSGRTSLGIKQLLQNCRWIKVLLEMFIDTIKKVVFDVSKDFDPS